MCVKENIICVFQDNKPVEFASKSSPSRRSASKSSPLVLPSPTALYKEPKTREQSADVPCRVPCSQPTYSCTTYVVVLINLCTNSCTQPHKSTNVFSVLGEEDPECQEFCRGGGVGWGGCSVDMKIAVYLLISVVCGSASCISACKR